MKHLLWFLIAGTRGGEVRGRILLLLKQKPLNANQIASSLSLDYKTIRHHLNVLEKNSIVIQAKKGEYGSVYFISEIMENNMTIFTEIWEKFGKN